jgi:hypothetical protein
VITSVDGGKATETRAFLLNGMNEEEKHFELQTIIVEEFSQSRAAELSDNK